MGVREAQVPAREHRSGGPTATSGPAWRRGARGAGAGARGSPGDAPVTSAAGGFPGPSRAPGETPLRSGRDRRGLAAPGAARGGRTEPTEPTEPAGTMRRAKPARERRRVSGDRGRGGPGGAPRGARGRRAQVRGQVRSAGAGVARPAQVRAAPPNASGGAGGAAARAPARGSSSVRGSRSRCASRNGMSRRGGRAAWSPYSGRCFGRMPAGAPLIPSARDACLESGSVRGDRARVRPHPVASVPEAGAEMRRVPGARPAALGGVGLIF